MVVIIRKTKLRMKDQSLFSNPKLTVRLTDAQTYSGIQIGDAHLEPSISLKIGTMEYFLVSPLRLSGVETMGRRYLMAYNKCHNQKG